MKWLLIVFLTDVRGDYAVTQVMYSREACVLAGETVLSGASRQARRYATVGSYECWPTAPEQVAFIGDGAGS